MPKSAPVFVLALNSPLYAPVALAVARARQDPAAYPSLANSELWLASELTDETIVEVGGIAPPRDSLLAHVLRRGHNNNRLLVAVCDPMRLCSVATNRTYDKPFIVGTLVDRMCYWLFDGNESLPDDGWHEAFEKVIVHRAGLQAIL